MKLDNYHELLYSSVTCTSSTSVSTLFFYLPPAFSTTLYIPLSLHLYSHISCCFSIFYCCPSLTFFLLCFPFQLLFLLLYFALSFLFLIIYLHIYVCISLSLSAYLHVSFFFYFSICISIIYFTFHLYLFSSLSVS